MEKVTITSETEVEIKVDCSCGKCGKTLNIDANYEQGDWWKNGNVLKVNVTPCDCILEEDE